MSGMLGQLLGGLLGGGAQGQTGQPPLVGILEQALAQQGGIGGILAKFQQAGLGEQVNSWVGAGANQPVSPEQVGQALPPEQIAELAGRFGVPPETVQQILAQALPHVVDQATPAGEVPPPSQTPDLGSLLGGLLGAIQRR
jgi:uncharacterized protein YidB (DUF937 family)